MIQSKTHFEITINDRKYELICEPSSPLGELHDVICQFKGEIVGKIQEIMTQETQSESKEEEENGDGQAAS